MSKHKDNPYVSLETCNFRHTEIGSKIDEILWILKGDPKNPNDGGGLVGSFRDSKRDRKWVYALLTMIGIPMFFLLIKYFFFGGL